jgi:hypothetical protein
MLWIGHNPPNNHLICECVRLCTLAEGGWR